MTPVPERQQFARESLAFVERKLPHVQLQMGAERFTRVLREDGSAVENVTQPFPVPPGRQTLTLSGSGSTRTIALDVPNRPGTVAVILSPTEPAPSSAPDQPSAAPAPGPVPAAAPVEQPTASTSPLQTAGWITVGAGVAAIAAGTYFGLKSFAIRDSACPSRACDASGLDRIHGSATATAIASTVAFGAGGAALVGGIMMLLAGRPSRPQGLVLRPGLVGGGAAMSISQSW
jgi:hypothetical protein